MKIKTKQYAIWAGLLLCTALGASAVPVTFQVNMEYQITNAPPGFDPLLDTVEVKGSFNAWTAGVALTNIPGTLLYQATYDVSGTSGSTMYYKFHIYGSRDTWENLQGYIYGNPDGNRSFALGSSDQSLPPAYFNDIWGGTVPLTVQVDMLAQILAGNFIPGNDTVELKGSFDGWNLGFALTNDPTGTTAPTNVYSTTLAISSPAPGGLGAYKFHIYGSQDHWESDPNRIMMVTSPETTLPLVCFNRACSVPIPVALYLQVDMNSQILAGNFDPTTTYQL